VTTELNLIAGDPNLLGATPVEGGVNFALYSHHGTRVELVLYDRAGRQELARQDLPARTGDIWHGFAPKLVPGHAYGYRVHGPYQPETGHLFNPHKLLLDPYAKALVGDFVWDASHFAHVVERQNPGGPMDTRDNAAFVSKAVIVDPNQLSPLPRKALIPWRDTLIYELHAKGFTMRHPAVPEADRGKFAGLASDAALDYLKALGVTSLELLPIHAIVHDKFLVDQGLRNYWGYNTLNYFCPHGEYADTDPSQEMRAFVTKAHDKGFEVILDVVYNHTCEGGRGGPSLSFRGIDNAAYYRLQQKDPSQYDDISGCGSTLNVDNPQFRQLIRDSLAHWVSAYGVDGFRFDIAISLGIDRDRHFRRDAPFFQETFSDPRLKDVKLIAEAWDAAGGYQVGGFPRDWADWNDSARNAYRQFWRGDPSVACDIAAALSGSADLFRARGKPIHSSINFVACHDGFPLYDLTRYAHKHNLANGENNRDGGDHDFSCNYGVEGPSQDWPINELRDRQARNMLANMFLSFGTPMLLAGDEFGRTQGGNNNAYAQDNLTSWIDWSLAETAIGRARLAFTRRLIALRKAIFANLPDGPPNGPGELEPTIAWWSVWGSLMSHADWMNPQTKCFGALIEPGGWLILVNASEQDVQFVLPPTGLGTWRQALNTADPTRPEGEVVATSGQTIHLEARALVVFKRDTNRQIGKSGHGF
jgi:isoamylase